MMAFISLIVCDLCEAAGEQRAGTRHRISIDGRNRIIDLCDEHNGAVLAPLVATLAGVGRTTARSKSSKSKVVALPRPTAKAAKAQQVQCTEPGCSRTFADKAARNRHIGQGHKRDRSNAPAVSFSA